MRQTIIFALFVLLALYALGPPRVEVSLYETGGVLWAVYTAKGCPSPFILQERVVGAVQLNRFTWAIPVPREGLPVLHFQVGTEVHSAPAIAKA